jgi:peptidyl-prolyl cis-trans isomerase C
MSYVKPTLLLLAAAVATACSKPQDEEPQAPQALEEALGTELAATVNGDSIPMSVFRLYALNTIGKSADTLTAEERQALLDDLTDFTLLVQAAEKEGLFAERRFAAELALQRLQTVATAMARRHVQRDPPTPAEIRAVYDENLADLKIKEYKLHHIVLDEAAAAREVIKDLEEGQTFEAVAKEFIENPGSGIVGDLGWVSQPALPDPMRDLIESLEVGGYSPEPVQTEYGYHVILLEDKREVDAPSPDEIEDQLLRAAENRKLDEFVKSLRSEATVDIRP